MGKPLPDRAKSNNGKPAGQPPSCIPGWAFFEMAGSVRKPFLQIIYIRKDIYLFVFYRFMIMLPGSLP
jgi:hypothetical protein